MPARICRAPMNITVAPTTPISTVAERLISEMAVRVRSTFSSRRCTPPAKTPAPPAPPRDSPSPRARRASDSVSRPVTSAVILPRSRKIGRMRRNALRRTKREDGDEHQRQQRQHAG